MSKVTLDSMIRDSTWPDDELVCLQEARAELSYHRVARTLVACTICGRGVRNQHSVDGMCPACAEAELERLRVVVCPDDVPRASQLYQLQCWAEDLKQTGRHSDIASYLEYIIDALEVQP